MAVSCGPVHVADVYVAFPDGSLKRPDISVFCREPDQLDIAPGFYLGQGVKDVVIFDPLTLLVLHARRDGTRRLTSEVAIDLECGCSLRA